MRLVLKLLINALALWVAGELVSGINLEGDFWTILLVALIFGLVNTFIKPVLKILSFPVIILTIGLVLAAAAPNNAYTTCRKKKPMPVASPLTG